MFLLRGGLDLRTHSFWTGGTDLQAEAMWIWHGYGKEFSYTAWSPGQPDNWNGQHCMYLDAANGYGWDDGNCNGQVYSICEMMALTL